MIWSGGWASAGQIKWVMNKQADKFFERYNALHKIKLVALKAMEQMENKWKIEKLILANLGFRFNPGNKVCGNFIIESLYDIEGLWDGLSHLLEEMLDAPACVTWLLYNSSQTEKTNKL